MAEIVTMPKLGFDMAEGLLVRWVVSEGDAVKKGELLAEIETDKATVEVESPYDGVVLKHIVGEDSVVPINDPIAVVGEAGEEVDLDALVGSAGAEEDTPAAQDSAADASAAPAPVAMEAADEGAQLPDGVRASPLARKVAKDSGVNITQVNGSGPKGRIVKKDVEAFVAGGGAKAAPSLGAAPTFATAAGEDVIVPLTKLRQAIGRRLTESKQHFPHFYVTYDYDLDKLMQVRKEANAMLADSGGKLSVNDFIIKAAALTLRKYPNLNAALGDGVVIQKGEINIGIAVAVEGGLLTVVAKNADFKPLSVISAEVKEMAGRVRSGKIHPEDVSGSTFTTSNLGMYGVDEFTAIINPPEAAILALGGARQEPVVKNGEIVIGWKMKATISVDHRVSDGAEAAEFMKAMAAYLENPAMMIV
jgi:pyruvate dehydrogenase E2 component (dihydrolipoamide acetyltransferase)